MHTLPGERGQRHPFSGKEEGNQGAWSLLHAGSPSSSTVNPPPRGHRRAHRSRCHLTATLRPLGAPAASGAHRRQAVQEVGSPLPWRQDHRCQERGREPPAGEGGGKQPEGLEIPSHHQRKAAGTHPTPTPSTPPSSLSVVPTGVRRQGVWDLGGALGGEGASADREGPQRILYTGTMQSVSVCPRA